MQRIDIEYATYSILNEDLSSPFGELDTGVGTSPQISTSTQIHTLTNDGLKELARQCWPYYVESATNTPASGVRSIPYTSFTVSDSSTLRDVRGVMYNGVQLQNAERAFLELKYPTWMTDAVGTPLYWYSDGNQAIGIYPRSPGSLVLTANGLGIPADLAADATVPTWLPADYHQFIPMYNAWKLTAKNLDDANLAVRAMQWKAAWKASKLQILTYLWQTSPEIASAHFLPLDKAAALFDLY